MSEPQKSGQRSYYHRVLLVVNEQAAGEQLKKLLTSKGYMCEIALSWVGACEKIAKELIDLIVCDYRLKEKNGIELISEAPKIKKDSTVIQGLVLCNFSDLN
ncbi:response regulator [Endozoicomonas atrinae]|uniref:response regulator n=1 Tax=Endozoicomonas atrinae TaxID=1333660 RepID=UPI003AFFFEE3